MGPQRRVSSPRISIKLKLRVCDLGNMNGHNMKMGINDELSLILFLLLPWETVNEEFKGERLMFLGLWFQHIMARQAMWQSRGRLRTAMDKERKTQLASLNTEMVSVNSDRAALQTRHLSHPIYWPSFILPWVYHTVCERQFGNWNPACVFHTGCKFGQDTWILWTLACSSLFCDWTWDALITRGSQEMRGSCFMVPTIYESLINISYCPYITTASSCDVELDTFQNSANMLW